MSTKTKPRAAAPRIHRRPSFGQLRAALAFFGPSGKGTPRISDGDSARVLFFFNLSGAYNGNAGADKARKDAEIIAHRVNIHAAILRQLKAAECFMGGFEDDDMQPGINRRLSFMRRAIAKAEGRTT